MDNSEGNLRELLVDDTGARDQARRLELPDISNPAVPILEEPMAPDEAVAEQPKVDKPTARNEADDEPTAPEDAAQLIGGLKDVKEEEPDDYEEVEDRSMKSKKNADPLAPDDAAEADPSLDQLRLCLAMNGAYQDLIDDLMRKAELGLRENRHKQGVLVDRKEVLNKNATMVKRKVPVSQFLPPYIKDECNMVPPQNKEAKEKMAEMIYDPLLKEEKKWSAVELQKLHEAVRGQLIEQRLTSIYGQRELVLDKVREADATTTPKDRAAWTAKLEKFQRKIDYEKTLPDNQIFTGKYEDVDWASIAMQSFKGLRSSVSLKAKWMNEQSPQWSKADWTAQEVQKLYGLATKKHVSWNDVAVQLGTRRTPWQCFEKFKSEIANELMKREWTKEEDERLVNLVTELQLNGAIQWDKVTYHMGGRSRQQCRTRYLRTLDKAIKHGRWTDEEDLLLMCSIGRYGAKDWRKIAKGVPGRNDGQCRERWVNVLDRANRSLEWTMEEDETLVYAVNMFGKGQWAKIAEVLEGRSEQVCKSRFRTIMSTKMRICSAQLSKIHGGHVIHKAKPDRRPLTLKEWKQQKEENPDRISRVDQRVRLQQQIVKLRRYAPPKLPLPEVRAAIEGIKRPSQRYTGSRDYGRERRWSEMSNSELFGDDNEPVRGYGALTASKNEKTYLPPLRIDTEITEVFDPSALPVIGCLVDVKEEAPDDYEENSKQKPIGGLKEVKEEEPDDYEEEEDRSMSSKMAAAITRRKEEARARREKEKLMEAAAAAAAPAAKESKLHPIAAAAKKLLTELPRIAQMAETLLAKSGKEQLSMGEVLEHITDSLKHHTEEYAQMRVLVHHVLEDQLVMLYALGTDLPMEVIMKTFYDGPNCPSKRLKEEVEKPRRKSVAAFPAPSTNKTESGDLAPAPKRKKRTESLLAPRFNKAELLLAQQIKATPAPSTRLSNKRQAGESDEAEEEKKKRKELPVKKGRGRPRKSAAPPSIDFLEAEDTVDEESTVEVKEAPVADVMEKEIKVEEPDEEDEMEGGQGKEVKEEVEEEEGEKVAPSTKRRSSRSCKSPLKEVKEEEENGDEKVEMTSSTKRRSVRNRKFAAPPVDEVKYTAEKEVKEEVEMTPSVKRRAGRPRKSAATSIDKEEKVEDKKEEKAPKRGRGRPRKSVNAKEEVEKKEEKEDTVAVEEKDIVAGQEEALAADAIPAMKEDTVSSQEDAQEDTVPDGEDTVTDEKKSAQDDTVPAVIDAQEEAVPTEEGTPEDTITDGKEGEKVLEETKATEEDTVRALIDAQEDTVPAGEDTVSGQGDAQKDTVPDEEEDIGWGMMP